MSAHFCGHACYNAGMDLDERRLRQFAAVLGLGAAAFGALPMAAPGFFGRLFGLDARRQPAVEAAIRSVGVRDLVLGLGLWSAAVHGGNFRPWLLSRTLSDTGDTLATFIAICQGARNPRFLALSLLALAASATGSALWLAERWLAGSREDGNGSLRARIGELGHLGQVPSSSSGRR